MNNMNNSWGVTTVDVYVSWVKRLVSDFHEKEKANNERIAKRQAKGNHWTYDIKNVTFKKFPIDVAVNNFGYEIHYVMCHYRTGKSVDYNHYTYWMINEIESGNITIEALAAAWRDYDIAVKKAKWFNYSTYIKYFDMNEAWDRHYINSDNICDHFIEDPISILHYQVSDQECQSKFRYYMLTNAERDELSAFFKAPENHKVVVSKLKALRKKVEAIRPTADEACNLYLSELFCDSYGENSVNWNTSYGDRSMWKPRENTERSWYGNQENWSDGDAARSFKKIITESINEFLPDINERLEAFQSGLHVTINDEGNHKSSHSDVHCSSFWTYYTNNFSIDIDIYKSDKTFHKLFEDVTVNSSYYSGGW